MNKHLRMWAEQSCLGRKGMCMHTYCAYIYIHLVTAVKMLMCRVVLTLLREARMLSASVIWFEQSFPPPHSRTHCCTETVTLPLVGLLLS